MKKCVIVDLDGTLVHSLPDIAAAMNRSLQKYGLPVFEESAYKYKVGNGVLKLTERSVGEHKELYDQVLAAYKADYAVNNQVNSHAYKGVPELLKGLTEKGVDFEDVSDQVNPIAMTQHKNDPDFKQHVAAHRHRLQNRALAVCRRTDAVAG